MKKEEIEILVSLRQKTLSKFNKLRDYKNNTNAIMKEIVSSAKGKDAYFVNMSDGMPYYNDYGGEAAHKHTREQVKKMKLEGIKVISYFITGSYISDSEREAFTAMYGKEAQFIDTNKLNEVAKSMNNKFL